MGWAAEKFENFDRLPRSLLVVHIFSKLLFGMGLGILLASYFSGLNWHLYGWLLIILSLIIAMFRKLIKPFISPGSSKKSLFQVFLYLSDARILCRFLLLSGVGFGALLASYSKDVNLQLYGWILILVSIIITIPSNYAAFKK